MTYPRGRGKKTSGQGHLEGSQGWGDVGAKLSGGNVLVGPQNFLHYEQGGTQEATKATETSDGRTVCCDVC